MNNYQLSIINYQFKLEIANNRFSFMKTIAKLYHSPFYHAAMRGLFFTLIFATFPGAIQGQTLSKDKPNTSSSFNEPHLLGQTENAPPKPFQPIHRQPGDRQPFQPETLPLLPQEVIQTPSPYRVVPSITVGTPSAYGASWGSAAIGIGLQSRTRFSETADGVVGLKIGLGDAEESIGAEISLTLVDLDSIFSDGSLSFKIHRALPEDFNIAVGVQGATNFGTTDGGSSVYGVLTKRFLFSRDPQALFSQLHLSIGAGGGQFRSEDNAIEGIDSVGFFGSTSVRVTEWSSAIVEWTGQDLTIGFSLVPFPEIPLVIVPALTDITGTAGDGTRFLFSAGYSFQF
ncbi:MAG: hypothetical protein AAGA60_13010 [Cyanobacteria bacterium P01_E01_bin.42]